MSDAKSPESKLQERHQQACDQRRDFYVDPETGHQVMTAYFLKNRGHCCESACRHCPYGFNSKEKTRP